MELTFHDDEGRTGSCLIDGDTHPFTYDLNTPQSGDVCLLLDDERVVILVVVSVNDTTLVIRKKGEAKEYSLYRQF